MAVAHKQARATLGPDVPGKVVRPLAAIRRPGGGLSAGHVLLGMLWLVRPGQGGSRIVDHKK
jgi:hypothetical protein